MKFQVVCVVVLLSLSATAGAQGAAGAADSQAPSLTSGPAPVVFVSIFGPDATALREFYANVFDWQIDGSGNFAAPVTATLEGTIGQDPAEHRLYMGVGDITATLEQIVEHGGSVEAPRFEVPGVVILGLFRDPAGNPMALVELGEDGKAKVP
jgi:hypothetical protein